MTQQRLIHEASDYSQPGGSIDTIHDAVRGRRRRGSENAIPRPRAVELIAAALDVPPETFAIYPISLACAALDDIAERLNPEVSGWGQAQRTAQAVLGFATPRAPEAIAKAEARRSAGTNRKAPAAAKRSARKAQGT